MLVVVAHFFNIKIKACVIRLKAILSFHKVLLPFHKAILSFHKAILSFHKAILSFHKVILSFHKAILSFHKVLYFSTKVKITSIASPPRYTATHQYAEQAVASSGVLRYLSLSADEVFPPPTPSEPVIGSILVLLLLHSCYVMPLVFSHPTHRYTRPRKLFHCTTPEDCTQETSQSHNDFNSKINIK